jgi:VIT1/CCC1 family predicted Fe2+/Mn2+ transporter
MRHSDAEHHYMQRIGWLRAAVLGANDGIVSNASLVLGIAASGATTHSVLIAGVAGLVAGSMSMAAGEYVSVSSQSDTESSDRERERVELEINPAVELEELAQIYMQRGLDRPLAVQVATQLTAKDALGAHLRDELGLHDARQAQPVQAALTSAVTFAGGALLPLLILALGPREYLNFAIPAGSLAALGLIGAAGARTGGSKITVATARIMFWGAFAMALTYAAGRLFGVVAG